MFTPYISYSRQPPKSDSGTKDDYLRFRPSPIYFTLLYIPSNNLKVLIYKQYKYIIYMLNIYIHIRYLHTSS